MLLFNCIDPQCGCGNDPPEEKFKKEESYCDRACPADPGEMCGGYDNRVNVYKMDDALTTPDPSTVEGRN